MLQRTRTYVTQKEDDSHRQLGVDLKEGGTRREHQWGVRQQKQHSWCSCCSFQIPRSKLDIYLHSQRFTTHEESTYVAQIAKTFQGVSRILKGDKIIEGGRR